MNLNKNRIGCLSFSKLCSSKRNTQDQNSSNVAKKFREELEELCNDTELVATKLSNHVIEEKVMLEKQIGTVVYIPLMSMSPLLIHRSLQIVGMSVLTKIFPAFFFCSGEIYQSLVKLLVFVFFFFVSFFLIQNVQTSK